MNKEEHYHALFKLYCLPYCLPNVPTLLDFFTLEEFLEYLDEGNTSICMIEALIVGEAYENE